MKQKPIEKISHDINVDVILKCLWAIRDHDQFYFNSYGREMIENCIQQKLEKEGKIPDVAKSEEQLSDCIRKFQVVIKDGKSDFIFGWRKCYNWLISSSHQK